MGQYLQLEVNEMAFFFGAIAHTPRIILWAFTGTGAIAPVSWQALWRHPSITNIHQ
jgi:hypothetical protein